MHRYKHTSLTFLISLHYFVLMFLLLLITKLLLFVELNMTALQRHN